METCDQCGPHVRAMKLITVPPSIRYPKGGILTYCDHCTTVKMVGLLRANAKVEPIGEASCVPQPA